jgi:hypothetical protein
LQCRYCTVCALIRLSTIQYRTIACPPFPPNCWSGVVRPVSTEDLKSMVVEGARAEKSEVTSISNNHINVMITAIDNALVRVEFNSLFHSALWSQQYRVIDFQTFYGHRSFRMRLNTHTVDMADTSVRGVRRSIFLVGFRFNLRAVIEMHYMNRYGLTDNIIFKRVGIKIKN